MRFGPGPASTVQPVIEITGTAQKEAWDRQVLPPVELVRPGLWSVPVPIPNNPLRYVLVYLFELENGVALIDAGWNTEAAWQALKDGLAQAGGSLNDVQAVVVTHIHPDHYGLAGRVREVSGAWVGLHPADAALLRGRYVEMDELVGRMQGLLAMSGVPEDKQPDLAHASLEIRSLVSMAEPDVLIEDDQKLDLPGWDLRAIWTPGHSPGHICLFSDRHQLLLSGDHVLPRITPNISFHSQQEANPLRDYLDSLARLRIIDPDEVLPAHEYRFTDLNARLGEIEGHHEARLKGILDALRERPGLTAWEITLSLTWSRPWDEIPSFMQRGANGETLAHLVLLESRHQVRREQEIPAHFYLVD
jgi:glyoxylase-like metal-dependent hydrolase (beta-lactamase superfamily II)